MTATTDLLTPGDVIQCAKPNDADQYRKDEIVGTVVFVRGKGWLRGADVDGTVADWRGEYRDAFEARHRRVRAACRRDKDTGELTGERLAFVAVVAYRTVIWAPKETPDEKAQRSDALDRWKTEAAQAFVAGQPQPPRKRPQLGAWKVDPFSAPQTFRRWFFLTLPQGAKIRAARGPEHTKAEKAKARARRARSAWLSRQRQNWQAHCRSTPPLAGVRPRYRRPPVRRTWSLCSVTQAAQLELGVAA